MSNNRNRNRNRSGQAQGQSLAQGGAQGPQDKPFVYKGKNGLITIPSGTVFDPDAEVFVDIAEAQRTGNDVLANAAMVNMIKSGFPSEIAETIRLKASEIQDFTDRYMRFTGTNLPK